MKLYGRGSGSPGRTVIPKPQKPPGARRQELSKSTKAKHCVTEPFYGYEWGGELARAKGGAQGARSGERTTE